MSGGGSSGTQSSTQVQKSEPWAAQKPYLQDTMGLAQARYRQGGPEFFPGSTVTPFSPQTEYGLQAQENRALTGNPLNFAAQQSIYDTLGGGYMNPAIGALSDRLAGDVRQRVDSAYAGAGRGPSAGYAESLGRGIGDALAPVQFGAYENERGRQMQAAAMAPQLAANDYMDISMLQNAGAQREAQAQRVLGDEMARYNYGATLEDQLLNDYIARIQGGYGGTTTSTMNQPLYSNGLATGLGMAATGAGIAGSLFAPQFGVFPGLLGSFA